MRRLLALALLALAACDTAFVVEVPPEDPRLVLSALFVADSALVLQLRSSGSAFEDLPPGDVRNATVEVFVDGAPAGLAAYEPARQRYAADVRPQPGQRIAVRATAPGFEPIEAEDRVPAAVPFEVVSVERGPASDGGRPRVDRVTIRFADPPGEDHYAIYGIAERTYPSRPDYSQRFPLFFRSADPALADGLLIDLLDVAEAPLYQRAVFRSTPFEGQAVTLELEVQRQEPDASGQSETTDRLRLARVSETYYGYVRALETGSMGPFDDTVGLPSNVTGGYGIFAALTAMEIVLP